MKKLIILLNLFFCLDSFADPVKITWVIPEKSDIRGYFFELESESGLKVRDDIGLKNHHTIDLIKNKRYKIKIIPYDFMKREGAPSNMIDYIIEEKAKKINLPAPIIRVEK